MPCPPPHHFLHLPIWSPTFVLSWSPPVLHAFATYCPQIQADHVTLPKLLAPYCLILFRLLSLDTRPFTTCPQCASLASSPTIAFTLPLPQHTLFIHFYLFMLHLLNQHLLCARHFYGQRWYSDEHRQRSLRAYRLSEGYNYKVVWYIL